MAKDSIRDFSATAGSNTDIQSVNIDENCPASGINNAIRELMVDLKNVSTGAVNLETPGADQLNVDNIRLDGNTISTISGDMTLDAVGDIALDADGADIRLKHAGTEWGRFVDSTNNFLILNPIADKDIIFNGIDGSSEISALTLDMSDAGKAIFNGGATFGGNVGINNASPGQKLHVHGAAEFNAHDNTSGSGGYNASGLIIGNAHDAGKGSSVTDDRNSIIWNERGLDIDFATSNTYRMKLTHDGNLLVGTTSNNTANIGHGILANGTAYHTRDGEKPLVLNRKSSDGAIVSFRQDDSEQGYISTPFDTSLGIFGPGSTGAGFVLQSNEEINPGRNGTRVDASISLGNGTFRYDNLFAENGSIQTSDETEKQDIAALTTAEITAAKAISKLFKTYKFKSKVAAKGDAARKHSGVIAQEVQAAMTDAGLDASKYAFWCSDTWWETSVDVAAVEANEEADIEAKDAYTRIDTYNTADEAPTGATERTRLGVRYAELLAFIGAATEQRLGDIETRLTALEA